MMQAVAELTRPHKLKTYVSLNPVMVEGTGMCGACRVSIAGKTKFACIDGPEFDAHDVDFEEIAHRLNFYKDEEDGITGDRFKKKKCKGKCKSKGDKAPRGTKASERNEFNIVPLPLYWNPRIVNRRTLFFNMRARDPEKRKHDFKEVALGLTEKQAIKEANRCIQCKKPMCVTGCPVEINIPAFISAIRDEGHHRRTCDYKKIQYASCDLRQGMSPGKPVPGQVCPWEKEDCHLYRCSRAVCCGLRNQKRTVSKDENVETKWSQGGSHRCRPCRT